MSGQHDVVLAAFMFHNVDSITISRAENGYIIEYVHVLPDVQQTGGFAPEAEDRVAVFAFFSDLVDWLQAHWPPTPPTRA